MTTISDSSATVRQPALLDQTVVIIGGSSGIGLETARLARNEGADVVLTARDPERLRRGGRRRAPPRRIRRHRQRPPERLLPVLSVPVDHIMVTAGSPYYAPFAGMDIAEAVRYVSEHLRLLLDVARHAVDTVRPGGALLLVSGTGARRPAIGISITALLTAGLPALTANLALELARSHPGQHHRSRLRGHAALGLLAG